eukprot:scaffold78320_cov57-Phaeocystis_antarctica.AAC.2
MAATAKASAGAARVMAETHRGVTRVCTPTPPNAVVSAIPRLRVEVNLRTGTCTPRSRNLLALC